MERTTCTSDKYERSTAESGLATRNSKGGHKRYGSVKDTFSLLFCILRCLCCRKEPGNEVCPGLASMLATY